MNQIFTKRIFFITLIILSVVGIIILWGCVAWSKWQYFSAVKQSQNKAATNDIQMASVVQEEKKDEHVVVYDNFAVEWYEGGAKKLTDEEQRSLLSSIDAEALNDGALVNDRSFQSGILSVDDCKAWARQTHDLEEKCNIFIYEVGRVRTPAELSGKKMYLVFLPQLIEYIHPGVANDRYLAVFDETAHAFVQISIDGRYHAKKWFGDKVIKHDFAELYPPKSISLGEKFGTLIAYRLDHYWITGGLQNEITGEHEVPLQEKEVVHIDPTYGPIYFRNKDFYIKLAGLEKASFSLQPYFFGSNGSEIVWNEGTSNTDGNDNTVTYVDGGQTYAVRNMEGCSTGPEGREIVTNAPWFTPQQLTPAGKTLLGDDIFEMKHASGQPYYKEFYSVLEHYSQNDFYNKKIVIPSFAEFVADKPFIFWKDPMENWRVYVKHKYLHLLDRVGCGI